MAIAADCRDPHANRSRARITVDPLSRHGQASSSPNTSASYMSAVVTVDAITGTWTTSSYQMRLDSTTNKQYIADDTVDLDSVSTTGQLLRACPIGSLDRMTVLKVSGRTRRTSRVRGDETSELAAVEY